MSASTSTSPFPNQQHKFFSLAVLASTFLLGTALVLVHRLVWGGAERSHAKRRDKQIVSLMFCVGAGITGVDAFLSETASPSSTILFGARAAACLTRTLVLLSLVHCVVTISLLRRKYRAGFGAAAVFVSILSGGALGWATFGIILRDGGADSLVQLAGLAGVLGATAILVAILVILLRSSASKVLIAVALALVLLQIAESLFFTVEQIWIWLLTVPLSNAYIVFLLLVLHSSAPHNKNGDTKIDSDATQPSPPSNTTGVPSAPSLVEARDLSRGPCLDSRWSSETSPKRKGLRTILKSATPSTRRAGGHRRLESSNGGALDVQLESGQENRVRFAPFSGQQQEPTQLAPKPSIRSLLRSPSSTAAGKPDPSPASSFSSDTTATFPPPPLRTPVRSATYPPVPSLPRVPPPMPSQQQFRFPPPRPTRVDSSELPYAASPESTLEAGGDRYPRPAPPSSRLINPYSPMWTAAEAGEVVLDLRREHSSASSLNDPEGPGGERKVAGRWTRER